MGRTATNEEASFSSRAAPSIERWRAAPSTPLPNHRRSSANYYIRIGRWLCLAGATLGALGLLSDAINAEFLLAITPGQPTMNPNTAVALVLVGVAAALRSRVDIGVGRKILSFLATGLVLAMGVGTLAEYAFGAELGIDRLFVQNRAEPRLGRPALPTALSLTFLGAALLSLDVRPHARVHASEWLSLAAGFTAFTALLGFAFDASLLYRWPQVPVVGVALPTAVALVLVSLGVLLERPERSLLRIATSAGPGGLLLRRLILPSMLAPVLVGLVANEGLSTLGHEELSLVFAIMASVMTVLGLALLTATAVQLNDVHHALDASRVQTQMLIEQAPDGIFVANLAGQYTDVNSAGCRMLGLRREEIVGRTILDLLPQDEAERLLESKKQMLQGETALGEWRLLRKDGSFLPVEVNANILPDGRWQALVRDISERKRLEESLERSHADLNRAQAVANIGSWRLDMRHGVLCWSAESYRIFEIPFGTPMTYEGFLSCVHPGDRSRVAEAWNAAMRGRPYDIEHRIIAAGQVKWVREKADLEFDDEGRLVSGIGITHEITERRQRDEALRISEAKSSGILSISPDAIISIDQDQRITLFNEGAEKIFGYSKAEALGAPLDILIPERFRAIHRQHVERFASTPESVRPTGDGHREVSGLRKNGEEFPADAAISKLEVDGTKILTVVLRDITDRKQLERDQLFLAEFGAVLALTLDYEETAENVARLVAADLADVCIVDVKEARGHVRASSRRIGTRKWPSSRGDSSQSSSIAGAPISAPRCSRPAGPCS